MSAEGGPGRGVVAASARRLARAGRGARAAARSRLLRYRPVRLSPGATVIVVYFKTPDLIRICLDRIERHAVPALREVMVVDNASGDGVARSLATRPRVRSFELPRNYGHAWALDWAAWKVRTRYFVTLDSDAWPVSDEWLPSLLGPLEDGAACSGIAYHRQYIHPSCLAMETATFRRYGLSFMPNPPPSWPHPELGSTYWDTGEGISLALRRRGMTLHGYPTDKAPTDDVRTVIGSTYGGIVYHLWSGTRVQIQRGKTSFDGIPREVIEEEIRRWTEPDGVARRGR